MAKTKVVSFRLPEGSLTKLKLLACKRSLEQGREVRWASIVKQTLEDLLAEADADEDEKQSLPSP
jgi:hypothetical protein